jgi:hypothetical protein
LPRVTAPDVRQGLSWKVVAAGFGSLLLLGLGVAAFIYFQFIRYERTAAQHVPTNSTVALRLDVEQAILYEPFRKHLLPLADHGRAPPGRRAVLAPRRDRIKSTTSIDLAVDTREFVLALGPGKSDWLIIVGGKFPRSGVVEGLGRVLEEEGIGNELEPDGRILRLRTGPAIAQAADGSLLVGSGRERVVSAVPRHPAPAAFALTPDGAAAFAVRGEPLTALASSPALALAPIARELASVAQVSGSLALESFLELRVLVRPKPGVRAAELARELDAGLRRLKGSPAWVNASDWGGEHDALRDAEVGATSDGAVRIAARCERSALDRAAANLARWLRGSLF